ncbi:MAG: hypothetical protein Ct9H300mP12_04270 [Acidimicrobiales bacterium]|nr:MAG: hypothetical protein Ct9H300mP12_04270 [Acidimicrobiales bacterium]
MTRLIPPQPTAAMWPSWVFPTVPLRPWSRPLGRVGHVVDLAADFRLRDGDLYPTWYGEDHEVPDLLTDAAYGLPELFRPVWLTPASWPSPAVIRRQPLWDWHHCCGPVPFPRGDRGRRSQWALWSRSVSKAQHRVLCRERGRHGLRAGR